MPRCIFFKFHIILIIIVVLFTNHYSASAQRNELGVLFGGAYYMGDLNPHKHFAQTRMGGGFLYRLNVNEHVAARANIIWASVEANDAIIGHNKTRNLHFQSRITELSVQGEVNFLPFVPGSLETPSTPYVFGGVGVFWFNPQAYFDREQVVHTQQTDNLPVSGWYNLRELRTEGQEEEYARFSHNIVFGAGFKFNITQLITGAFEWGMRRTGTDYLDDVSSTYPDPSVFKDDPVALYLFDRSTNINSDNPHPNTNLRRGNPYNNDWYSFAGIILTFRIKNMSWKRCPAYL